KLGVTQAAVRAFLADLGQAEVPAELWPAKLVEIAARYRELEQCVANTRADDQHVAALQTQARDALAAGNFDRADLLLALIGVVQAGALDRLQREAAATEAQRADLALTRLRYVEAARHLAAAAERLAPEDTLGLVYLYKEAAAYRMHGDEFGDATSLH